LTANTHTKSSAQGPQQEPLSRTHILLATQRRRERGIVGWVKMGKGRCENRGEEERKSEERAEEKQPVPFHLIDFLFSSDAVTSLPSHPANCQLTKILRRCQENTYHHSGHNNIQYKSSPL
jgi:hypothetical protein